MNASDCGCTSCQAGAADLALPVRRHSDPFGGQGATRAERPCGLITNTGNVPQSLLERLIGNCQPATRNRVFKDRLPHAHLL